MTGSTDDDLKLVPEIVSFRLLVLRFVQDYWAAMGASPSYGEIAAKLSSNRSRVCRAIKRLAADRLLIIIPGPRGLRLPEARDAALRELRALGWSVDEDIKLARAPASKLTLLTTPALDYKPEPGAMTYPAASGVSVLNDCLENAPDRFGS